MRLDRLRTNTLSPAGFAWYRSYLDALDAKDLPRYGAFLADGCVMQTNSDPPVAGKPAVLAALAGYWATFGTLEHDLLNIYGSDAAFMLEAVNHYTRADGTPVSLRAVALTDRDAAGRVTSVRLYSDTRPLAAAG